MRRFNLYKHGILPNRKQTVEELFTSHRLKTQLDSMNLSVLKDRNLIVAAVTPSDTESGPIPQFLNQRFDAYLEWFWSYDTSPYIARKRRHGQSIGRAHCEERLRHIRNHWRPWLEKTSTTLTSISYSSLDDFSAYIGNKSVAGQTKNHILTTATSALKYAYDMRAIPENPARGLLFFSTNHRKCGVLTPEEARELFQIEWLHESAKLASLTTATTGLRAGEVAALRLEDIGEPTIADAIMDRLAHTPWIFELKGGSRRRQTSSD